MTRSWLLLEGPPRSGKTTLVRRVLDLLQERGVLVGGFTASELLVRGRRVGFTVEAIDGPSAVMAHRDLDGDVRVGPYGVDLSAFERVALPAIARARAGRSVVVIDEIGRMELASSAFVAALEELLADALPVLATVHVHRHPFTDELKTRCGVERVLLTTLARDSLPTELTARLEAALRATRRPRSP